MSHHPLIRAVLNCPDPTVTRRAAAVLRWLAAHPHPWCQDDPLDPYWSTPDLEALADAIDPPDGQSPDERPTTTT